jgi:hypothetical protein
VTLSSRVISPWGRNREDVLWNCTSATPEFGMPAGEVARLFDRFYRVGRARSRELPVDESALSAEQLNPEFTTS